MKIIFVRHGQTSENLAHRHQPEDTPLSVEGRKQAIAAAQRLQHIRPTHVVSSPLVRALQTASLIADQLDLIPSIDHATAEIKRPRSLTGHPHKSWRSLVFYKLWYVGLTRTGESYAEFRDRIATTQANITKLPPDAIVVVVSHTVFINMFVAHMCSNAMMSPWRAAATFLSLFKMKNTAMYEISYHSIEKGCGWVRTSDLNLE